MRDIVRAYGFKTVGEVMTITGQSYQTLSNWHKNKPRLFNVVLIGAQHIRMMANGE